MAFTSKLYGNALLAFAQKKISWTSDTLKLTLHTSAYNPDQDVHDFANDLTGELTTGGGYTAGGVTLTGATATYDGATNTLILDTDDVVINSSTLTWRTAVISDSTPGTSATNPLIAYFQSDADIVSSGGTTTITMPATGIVRMSAA